MRSSVADQENHEDGTVGAGFKPAHIVAAPPESATPADMCSIAVGSCCVPVPSLTDQHRSPADDQHGDHDAQRQQRCHQCDLGQRFERMGTKPVEAPGIEPGSESLSFVRLRNLVDV